MSNVLAIVEAHIRAAGADGLVNVEGGCGCSLGALAPCDHIGLDCEVARKTKCVGGSLCNYEFCCDENDVCDWYTEVKE